MDEEVVRFIDDIKSRTEKYREKIGEVYKEITKNNVKALRLEMYEIEKTTLPTPDLVEPIKELIQETPLLHEHQMLYVEKLKQLLNYGCMVNEVMKKEYEVKSQQLNAHENYCTVNESLEGKYKLIQKLKGIYEILVNQKTMTQDALKFRDEKKKNLIAIKNKLAVLEKNHLNRLRDVVKERNQVRKIIKGREDQTASFKVEIDNTIVKEKEDLERLKNELKEKKIVIEKKIQDLKEVLDITDSNDIDNEVKKACDVIKEKICVAVDDFNARDLKLTANMKTDILDMEIKLEEKIAEGEIIEIDITKRKDEKDKLDAEISKLRLKMEKYEEFIEKMNSVHVRNLSTQDSFDGRDTTFYDKLLKLYEYDVEM